MRKTNIKGETEQKYAYSPAVITEGAAKIVWLAGHGGDTADDGSSNAGDFEAQCRQTFRNLERTLARAGAKLSDLVQITVFLIDARYTFPMAKIRAEILGDDFPGSAAITVAGFANPEMMIEIQGIAVPQ